MIKVLVLGANGQLGNCLQDFAPKYSNITFYFASKAKIDVTCLEKIEIAVDKIMPDVVINTSAYTAVDLAETNQALAFNINETGCNNIGQVCAKQHIPVIHISTDYVFDGKKSTPYQPTDKTNPLNVYGKSKLAGEKALANNLKEHVIIRTQWVFSQYGNNFVKTMLKQINNKKELSIVNDQFGCPTYAPHLAKAIIEIAVQINNGKQAWGIFHYAGNSCTTWYEMAKVTFKEFEKQSNELAPKINPVSTEKYPTIALRPKTVMLDNEHIERTWSVEASKWQQGVVGVISKLKPS